MDIAASHEDHADAEAVGAALRSERDVSADLHGRTAFSRRPHADVERVSGWRLGRRCAGRPDPQASAMICGSTPAAAR